MKTWWLVRQAREAMYKSVATALSRQECTVEQYEVMSLIAGRPEGVTIAEVAHWMSREKHTVTGLLQRAEKAGIIFREKPAGSRNYVYYLTDKGDRVLAETRPIVTEVIGGLGEYFSEEDLHQVGRYMETIKQMCAERVSGAGSFVLA